MKRTFTNIMHRVRPRALALAIPALLLLFLFSSEKASAHPHVFVDCSLTFEFDDQGLKGVRQKWWFDEMFAAMILGDFDKDHNNKINPEEATAIEQGAFVNLENFDYFTRILVDGHVHQQVQAVEFKPSIEDSTLVYEFFVPLRVDTQQKHVIMVAIFDESFYTSVQMDPKNKVLNLPGKFDSTLELAPVSEMAYFYDQIIPEAAVLTLQPK